MIQFQTLKKKLYEKYCDVMPTGAGTLFFIQIFATLAFSVLYSTLVLYATNKLKLPDLTATGITATFVAFNYALHLIGGYLGGRFLSYRSLFAMGMIALLIGCLFISIPTITSLYWGLAFFLMGCGVNVTCINCMLTQLFHPTDKRREAAFLWNYSGMNIGFFIGFSISGYFQLTGGYQTLFILSGIGSLVAFLIVLFKWKLLGDIDTLYVRLSAAEKKMAHKKGLALLVLLFLGLRYVLENESVSNNLIMTVGIGMIFIIAYIAYAQPTKEAGNKVWGYLILAITSVVFWTLYQLAPMGLTLFAERNLDRHYLGMLIAPQWIQNINTVTIIVGAPILSFVFAHFRDRGVKLTLPVQFSTALLLIGTAFAILPIGIHYADAQGLTHFNWILVSYVLQSAGELFISPIGFAMVGQLAPSHLQGLLMGTWLMTIGVAATLSGYFSNMALGPTQSVSPLITNASYSHTFGLLGWTSIVTGILLLALMPWILKLTQETKNFYTRSRVNA